MTNYTDGNQLTAKQRLALSRKIKYVLARKAKSGWYPLYAPLGYKNVSKRINGKNQRIIEIYPEEAGLVMCAFQIFSKGTFSLKQLMEMMFRVGLRTRFGNRVSRKTIIRILQNPIYIGKMRYKGEILNGRHQPIVTEKVFNLCQKHLSQWL